MAGAFLFVGSFRRLTTMDLGFRTQGILQANFELGKQQRQPTVMSQLLEEVRATPQVESACATTNFPIGGGNADTVCKKITGCPAKYPLVVCLLPGNAHQSHTSVANPAFVTFLKLFQNPPLISQ